MEEKSNEIGNGRRTNPNKNFGDKQQETTQRRWLPEDSSKKQRFCEDAMEGLGENKQRTPLRRYMESGPAHTTRKNETRRIRLSKNLACIR